MLLPPALGFSPHLPVSVYGTGTYHTIAAFLDRLESHTTSVSLHHSFGLPDGFACLTPTLLAPVFPFRDVLSFCVPTVLMIRGTESQPVVHRLRFSAHRPRLTQSRSALLWKPWIFGLEDSPPPSRYSFRHSLFLKVHSSLRYALAPKNAPLPMISRS